MAKKRVNSLSKYYKYIIALVILIGGVLFGISRQNKLEIMRIDAPIRTSPFNQSIDFSNESFNDTYASTTSAKITTNPFTVEAWVNIPAPSSGNYLRIYPIITYTKPQSWLDYGYIFQLKLEVQETTGEYRPSFSALMANSPDNINSNYITVIAPTSIKPNTWHHIAITSYSKDSRCYLIMYLDGQLINTTEKYRANCSIYNTTVQTHNVVIAKPNTGAGGIGGYYFAGQLDEIRISNIVRYSTNFSLPKEPFVSDTSTQLLYHFDGNLLDSSINKIDSVMSGNHYKYVPSTIIKPINRRVFPTPPPGPPRVY